jgi:hypothetical protein
VLSLDERDLSRQFEQMSKHATAENIMIILDLSAPGMIVLPIEQRSEECG